MSASIWRRIAVSVSESNRATLKLVGKLTCRMFSFSSGGRKPAAAYLLMSEPLEPTGLNRVQVVKLDLVDAGDGKVAVTVPSVLFWKMVVFQFEEQ